MELARCNKGHVYNPMENATCPVCAAENGAPAFGSYGATMPTGTGRVDPIGATMPVSGGMDSIGATAPVSGGGFAPEGIGRTEPVTRPSFGGSDFVTKPVSSGIQSYEATAPISPNNVSGFHPVVGWLVCIDGADKGKDFRIRNGNNYIGRASSMDICIPNDTHISNENQAIIGYDDMDRMFFFGPARGANAVRVNGKMVINSVELKAYDVLTIGTSKFMFIPLCGERFDWNA